MPSAGQILLQTINVAICWGKYICKCWLFLDASAGSGFKSWLWSFFKSKNSRRFIFYRNLHLGRNRPSDRRSWKPNQNLRPDGRSNRNRNLRPDDRNIRNRNLKPDDRNIRNRNLKPDNRNIRNRNLRPDGQSWYIIQFYMPFAGKYSFYIYFFGITI